MIIRAFTPVYLMAQNFLHNRLKARVVYAAVSCFEDYGQKRSKSE
jgi:hypothetical protein